ncbi:uncharacterized mitochondrial protein AtMg00810-like [Brassica napus]|uniref:uncharacterized mitochondrial protein AtMg00810-like n=1 Tax=Brassica napus TaxID=3708 RepID=UPI0020790076|nr:uncharacterized mitochondrial protein AtMg00810-like [Brassica napus]
MDTKIYFNNNAVAHPIQATCSFARLSEEHVVFIGNLDQEYVPKTYEEAMEHEEWRASVGDEVGKLGARVAKTPLEDGYKVLREGEIEDKPYADVKHYRRMVGKLIYLTITRPDVCFAVNQVSPNMQAPKIHHWNMVERILRYLREAPGQGVWMGCNKNTEIVGYYDADWTGDRVDRRSTTDYWQ